MMIGKHLIVHGVDNHDWDMNIGQPSQRIKMNAYDPPDRQVRIGVRSSIGYGGEASEQHQRGCSMLSGKQNGRTGSQRMTPKDDPVWLNSSPNQLLVGRF